MASIRTAAQYVLFEAKDEICWIAVWKDGKGWKTESFWFDYDERTNRFEPAEADQIESLREILATDSHAILVNGYYFNLGDASCMTRDTLADALRWQYHNGDALLVDALISLAPSEASEDGGDEPAEDEMQGYDDDSDRGCSDCPEDECTGHCMSCYYRTV